MTVKHSSVPPCKGEQAPPPINRPVDYKFLMETLQHISERYPFVEISYMGTSVLGRGIPMVSLGMGGRKRKSVLYVGCHHSMEWLTTAVLLRFIEDYCLAYEATHKIYGISIQRLFRARCIHVIPQLNVDGADIQINGAGDCILRDRLISMNGGEDFTMWQANARGVDLNHNYNAGFEEYKALEASFGVMGGGRSKFSGELPESEPETASLASLLRYSAEIGLVLTLHTQGEEIYCAGSDKYATRSASIARLISHMTGYRVAEPVGSAAYGGLTDWYIKELHRPAFTLECGKGENPLPIEELNGIYEKLREALFSCPLLV